MSKFYPEIVARIARERGVEPHVAERIIKSQFSFVVKTMGENKFKGIRLAYFGAWGVKKGRLKHFKIKRDE